jgi:hypothetical protein
VLAKIPSPQAPGKGAAAGSSGIAPVAMPTMDESVNMSHGASGSE